MSEYKIICGSYDSGELFDGYFFLHYIPTQMTSPRI